MIAIRRSIPILFALLLAGGCQPPAPATDGSTVSMQIGSKQFTLEVANTTKSMEHGLMDRDSLPADRGMIFIFDNERVRGFWMKNVHFPLDVIFLDSNAKVVSIRHMQPMDESNVSSLAPAKYAIELNLNAAAEAGVKAGDRLSLPAGIAK